MRQRVHDSGPEMQSTAVTHVRSEVEVQHVELQTDATITLIIGRDMYTMSIAM